MSTIKELQSEIELNANPFVENLRRANAEWARFGDGLGRERGRDLRKLSLIELGEIMANEGKRYDDTAALSDEVLDSVFETSRKIIEKVEAK